MGGLEPDQAIVDGLESNEFSSMECAIADVREMVVKAVADQSKSAAPFHSLLSQLFKALALRDGLSLVLAAAPRYDFKHVKANGYRSLGKVVVKCLNRLHTLIKHILAKKDSYLFKRDLHLKELTSYVETLNQLGLLVKYAQNLLAHSNGSNLFFPEKLLCRSLAEEMQHEVDKVDQRWFYGRSIAFQFCDSMKKPMEIIHVAMATYSANYQEHAKLPYLKLLRSVFRSIPYLVNPEKRADQVVAAALSAEASFCKALWSLSEDRLMMTMSSVVSPSVPVEVEFNIDPVPVRFENGVEVCPSTVHKGLAPLQLRLLSHQYREGQESLVTLKKTATVAKSPYLLFHCHGGGFIAQTSKSHLPYARRWAKDLNVPIVCVDYSLAPECPFPRASEEVFFAYAWAVKNAHMLGSTAERVCLVGDSAGGNLLMTTMLRCAETGVRMPDGFMPIYTPTYVQFMASPSRIISMADPLLPSSILTRCLEAYTADRMEKVPETAAANGPMASFDSGVAALGQTPLCQVNGTSSLSNGCLGQTLPGDLSEFNGLAPQRQVPAAFNSPLGALPDLDDSMDFPEFAGRLVHSQDEEANLDDGDPSTPVLITDSNPPPAGPSDSYVIDLGEDGCSGAPCGNRSVQANAEATCIAMEDGARGNHCSALPRVMLIKQHPYLSPVVADEALLRQFPPVHFIASHLDPCLDDSVTFAKILDSVGVPVQLNVFDDLPHGFMNFFPVSEECRVALDQVQEWLGKLLGVKDNPPPDAGL